MAKPLERPRDPDLYETDFYAWTQVQAEKLLARSHNELDWKNLAEEIDSVGRSQKREIRHRLGVLLHHLLKWEYQPAGRCELWRATIREQRKAIRAVLADSPSLRRFPSEVLSSSYEDGRLDAIEETGLQAAIFPTACPWPIEQIEDTTFLPGQPWPNEDRSRS